MSALHEVLLSAQAAARLAGRVLTERKGRVRVEEKGPADLVTEADRAAQQAIESHLRQDFPEFYFIGEEGPNGPPAALSNLTNETGWIVDPLDGTTNYVHGLDNYCVSIALKQGAEIVLGVVLDPNRDQLYHAIRGQGAYRNDRPIRVSRTESLGDALVAASFSAKVDRTSLEVERFLRVLPEARAIRRLGSAALNLCYLAAGQLDAYWATSVQLWDVAAGLLLVTEAGGTVTSVTGQELDLVRPQFLAAATPKLHAELLQTLGTDRRTD